MYMYPIQAAYYLILTRHNMGKLHTLLAPCGENAPVTGVDACMTSLK